MGALVIVVGAVIQKPEQAIGSLLGFYGAMLSLFPAVVAMLRGFKGWSGTDVATGIMFGVASVIALTIWSWTNPPVAWYGPLAGPVVAAFVTTSLSLFWPNREAPA